MKKSYHFLVLIFLFSMALMTSCEYDFIVEPVVVPPDPTDTIHFASQIETIFNNNSNCTSCHSTGGQAPDYTTGNAYSSIMDMGLVNTTDPEASTIYWHPNPANTTEHTWKKYTEGEAQLVLQWIKQGAPNN